MSEKTLKFGDFEINQSEIHAFKQAIALDLVDVNQIVISKKFKHSNRGSKYYIHYEDGDSDIRPLCIILSQISGYTNRNFNFIN